MENLSGEGLHYFLTTHKDENGKVRPGEFGQIVGTVVDRSYFVCAIHDGFGGVSHYRVYHIEDIRGGWEMYDSEEGLSDAVAAWVRKMDADREA